MKKTFVFAALALCAAALAVSCEKKNLDQPESKAQRMTFTCEIEDNGTKLDINSQGKTTWEVGDEILIHGEYTRDGYCTVVTLTASDISADGKKATISFDVDPEGVTGIKPYDRTSSGYDSQFYAAYPASAVLMDNHCYWNTRFTDTNHPLMAGYSSKDNTKMYFRNLCGIIAFRVSGSFDSYTFEGNSGETVAYNPFQTRIRLKDTGSVSFDVVRDGDDCNSVALRTVSGPVTPDGTTVHLIGLPTGTNFSAGFTFKFKDGEDIVKIAKSNSSVNVALNKYLDLGDITSHLEDYVAPTTSDHKSGITDASDLSVGGTANCYVISAAGAYKFPVVKGNSDQSAGNVFGVELLWETYNNAEEVTPNSVIAAVDFDGEENYVYFQTPATLKPGNALIAAKNFEGAIIWSWHIWIPETAFTSNTYGYTTDCEIMSRNLGALADTQPGEVADPKSFGLLYQWGRKDPFLGVKAAGSTESATFYGTAMTVFDGQMSQAEAAAQPTVLANVSGIDWCSTVDRMYWGDQEKSGSKTIYDPCPAGYRVAGRKRAKIFTDTGSGLAGWSYDAEKYYFQVGAPVSTLPLCGYLKEDGTYATDAALVWNTHMDADTQNISYCQWVSSGESKKGQKERAKGGSIRCETIPAE